MRITKVLEYLIELPLELEYIEGRIDLPRSMRSVDRSSEGGLNKSPVISMLVNEGIDDVYDKLQSSPFFDWRVYRFKDYIDIASIPLSTKKGRLYLNLRIPRISLKTTALIGYYDRKEKKFPN